MKSGNKPDLENNEAHKEEADNEEARNSYPGQQIIHRDGESYAREEETEKESAAEPEEDSE